MGVSVFESSLVQVVLKGDYKANQSGRSQLETSPSWPTFQLWGCGQWMKGSVGSSRGIVPGSLDWLSK